MKKKNGYFVLFNNPYVKWARAAIKSFLDWHPDWEVEAWVVNTLHDKISGEPFNDPRVHIHFIDQKFLGFDREKEFCNSKRFTIFAENMEGYDKIITTDVDCLFRKRLSEIENELDTKDICLYVDDEADPKNRAGASFLAYKPSALMKDFWLKYDELLRSKRPFWWNDQICIYETFKWFENDINAFIFPYKKYCFSGLDAVGLEQCEVIQPRGPKDSPALSHYRALVEEVLSGKRQMDVLVLGSGPSGEKVKDLDLSRHYVIAINHAWMLTPFWTHHMYPDDYKGPFPRQFNQIQRTVDSDQYLKANLRFSNQEWRGNSMIYNALYYALTLKPHVIGTLGCDLYYPPGKKNHFYKGGSDDPMRFPKEWHDERMKRFLITARKEKVRVVNYSGETRGYNQFDQHSFPLVITNP